MKYFWSAALAVSCLSLIGCRELGHYCCDNDENLMTNSSCQTATGVRKRIDLMCGEKFTLDKFIHEEDEYHVLSNGSLIVPDLDFMFAFDS